MNHNSKSSVPLDRSVIPNKTPTVRLLIVGFLPSDEPGEDEILVEDRPILAWRISGPDESESEYSYSEACPILPGFFVATALRDQSWCFFDSQTGSYWNGDFSVKTRDAAVTSMVEALRLDHEALSKDLDEKKRAAQ